MNGSHDLEGHERDSKQGGEKSSMTQGVSRSLLGCHQRQAVFPGLLDQDREPVRGFGEPKIVTRLHAHQRGDVKHLLHRLRNGPG